MDIKLKKIFGPVGEGNSAGGTEKCNSGVACPNLWVNPEQPGFIYVQAKLVSDDVLREMGVPLDEGIVMAPEALFPGLKIPAEADKGHGIA